MKHIANRLVSGHVFQSTAVCLLIIVLLNGCAVGFMTSCTYDPKTGKSTKTVYSPLFSSDSLSLADRSEFRVSVVITRRVEPISYSLLTAVGGLTPDDMESKATAVVHFKNDSQQTYRIDLREIEIFNQGFSIKVPEIILNPGDRFSTKEILVKTPTYDTAFKLNLRYAIDGKAANQAFSMQRQKMDDIKRKNEERKR